MSHGEPSSTLVAYFWRSRFRVTNTYSLLRFRPGREFLWRCPPEDLRLSPVDHASNERPEQGGEFGTGLPHPEPEVRDHLWGGDGHAQGVEPAASYPGESGLQQNAKSLRGSQG